MQMVMGWDDFLIMMGLSAATAAEGGAAAGAGAAGAGAAGAAGAGMGAADLSAMSVSQIPGLADSVAGGAELVGEVGAGGPGMEAAMMPEAGAGLMDMPISQVLKNGGTTMEMADTAMDMMAGSEAPPPRHAGMKRPQAWPEPTAKRFQRQGVTRDQRLRRMGY
jgi:hypothetical protein